VPVIQSYFIEPIWEQFATLIQRGKHPLGCHKPRISDKGIFEKLVQVLESGCAYTGSPTSRVRTPRCAVGAMSRSTSG
jgi:hypothetical protein